uniref:Uncharacterized protein n=1 Tax=Echeneis naucrates TaxID=173247 RepID=A0A665T7F1_ECHNA
QLNSTQCYGPKCGNSVESYPPLSVGVSPNSVHSPTDMSRELRTVTTAARARPHFDFTMSILPAGSKGATWPNDLPLSWTSLDSLFVERATKTHLLGRKGHFSLYFIC